MPFKVAHTIPIPVPPPVAATGAAPPFLALAMGYPCVQQEGDNWCWVACTSMVEHRWKGSARKQCQIAGDGLNISTCCTAPGVANCDKTATNMVITASLVKVRPVVKPTPIMGGEKWMLSQLKLGAVVALWQWNDVSAGLRSHVVLVVGAELVGNEYQFIVHDPEQDEPEDMIFSELETARGRGKMRYAWTKL